MDGGGEVQFVLGLGWMVVGIGGGGEVQFVLGFGWVVVKSSLSWV